MHIVTRWHFLQAFPSPTSFSFHSNQEDSICFHSPSMLLKTWVDQLWHLTASTWQADILSSRVWCVFVLVSSVSWIKFQTFFRLVFTHQKDEGSSSQLPAYSKMLSIKIFNCSKQITAKLRLRSMLQVLKKQLKTINIEVQLVQMHVYCSPNSVQGEHVPYSVGANRRMNLCDWVRKDNYHSSMESIIPYKSLYQKQVRGQYTFWILSIQT